jgi:membrane protein
MLRALADRMRRDRIPLAAAGVTYHFFLAVFPLLFAVVAAVILAGNAISQEAILSTIQQVAPAGANEFLTGLVTQAQSAAHPQGIVAVALAVALALFSASSGMAALLQGIEIAAEVPPRPYVRRRAIALALVLGTLIVAGVGVVLGSAAVTVIDITWVASAIHIVLAVAVVAVVLAAIWAVSFTSEAGRRFWTVGASFAAVAIVVASWAMAVYASSFNGSFARTYGLFANIVVLLFWFFAVAMAVLFGAEIDAVRGTGSAGSTAGMDGSDRNRKETDMSSNTSSNTGTDTGPDTGTYRCDLCGETFETEERLRVHWDAEHASAPSVGAASRR